MACTPAPACKAALVEATQRWPNRRRTSDGICPRPEHTTANPTSDHELGNAFDISHDPDNGVDCAVLSRYIMFDPRVKYIIFNRQIYNPSVSPHWRPYAPGTTKPGNPHTIHMHVSIKPDQRNRVYSWWDVDTPEPIVVPPEPEESDVFYYVNTPEGDGAWVTTPDGAVFALGNAAYFGGANWNPKTGQPHLLPGDEVIGIGYRLVGYGYRQLTKFSPEIGYNFPIDEPGKPNPPVNQVPVKGVDLTKLEDIAHDLSNDLASLNAVIIDAR